VSWLNYHHLQYFWATARHGTIRKASKELHVSPQTVSAQIRALEQAAGEQLFSRRGRRLELTGAGRFVQRYADEIFALGKELEEGLRGAPGDGRRRSTVHVGVADALPSLLVHHVLDPLNELEDPVKVVCHMGKPERLLSELVTHDLDVVISDAPVPPAFKVGAFNHLLGRCGVTFVGAAKLARKLRPGFPGSLDGAPFLLPTPETAMRITLDLWFAEQEVEPYVVGEFADAGVLSTFAKQGEGVVALPSVVAEEMRRSYGLRPIGEVPELIERFYAISVERRVRHPAVSAICASARKGLFAE